MTAMDDDDCILLTSSDDESYAPPPPKKSPLKDKSQIIHLTAAPLVAPKILPKEDVKPKVNGNNNRNVKEDDDIILLSESDEEDKNVVKPVPKQRNRQATSTEYGLYVEPIPSSSRSNGISKINGHKVEYVEDEDEVMEINTVEDNKEIVEEEGDRDSAVCSDDFQTDAATEMSKLVKVLRIKLSKRHHVIVKQRLWGKYGKLCSAPLELHSKLAVKIVSATRKIQQSSGSPWTIVKNLMDQIDIQKLSAEEPLSAQENDEEESEEEDEETKAANKLKFQEKLKKKIVIFENALNDCSNKIKILDDAEVDWDKEDDHNSNYMQRDRLMRKYMNTYYQICELTKCSKLTGRPVQVRINLSNTTQYPDLEKSVEDFVNSQGYMFAPDYWDIYSVLVKQNEAATVHLCDNTISEIAKELHRNVIDIIQSRRAKDMKLAFPERCDEIVDTSEDPAIENEELAKALEENFKNAKTIKQVTDEFVKMQDEEVTNGNASAESSEVSEDEQESGDEDGGEDLEDVGVKPECEPLFDADEGHEDETEPPTVDSLDNIDPEERSDTDSTAPTEIINAQSSSDGEGKTTITLDVALESLPAEEEPSTSIPLAQPQSSSTNEETEDDEVVGPAVKKQKLI